MKSIKMMMQSDSRGRIRQGSRSRGEAVLRKNVNTVLLNPTGSSPSLMFR